MIEHTICRLKRYRIQSDIFRSKLRKYNRISEIVAGLVNYNIKSSELEIDIELERMVQIISNYARDLCGITRFLIDILNHCIHL